MVRSFDAPRKRLFEAWSAPELMKRWFHGPEGWTLVVCEADLRTGGTYRYVWRNANGMEMGLGGTYTEVTPPERVVATERFDQPWYPGEAVITTEIADEGERCTLTTTMRYESKDARDTALQAPIEVGAEASFARLAGLMAEQAAS